MFGDIGTSRTIDVVALHGLAVDDVAALVTDREGERPPTTLAERLHRETAGNPFFLGALLAHLEEVAHVRDGAGAWLTSTELDVVGVPDGVRAVIHRRLALLDAETRQALDVAAVCGLAFEERTVRGVLGDDLDGLVDALDAAASAGLLREEGAGQYSFTHALVRHSVLDNLSQTRAARLHWRIAETFERDPARSQQRIGQIAYHYSAGSAVGPADIVARVARAAMAAGEEAMRRLAFDEAANHFRTALDALDRMPPDPDLRYRALTSLGQAMNALGDADVGDATWLEAAHIAHRAGDAQGLYTALRGYVQLIRVRPPEEFRGLVDDLCDLLPPGDSMLRAAALGWRAAPWIGGDLSCVTPGDARLADEAVAMARRLGDASALASTLRSRLSAAEFGLADLHVVLQDARELVALRDAHGDDLLIETAGERSDLVRVLIRLGRTVEAEAQLPRGRQDARRNGERLAMNGALIIESALAAGCGRFTDAKRLAAEAADHAGSSRLVQLRFGAQIMAVRMEQGRLDEIVPYLRRLDVLKVEVPEWRAVLATALADGGSDEEAMSVLVSVDGAGVLTSGRPPVALAVRHLAEACRLLGARHIAAELLPHVEPWSGQLLLVLPGVSIEGAADRAIAHLLAVLGRLDEADAAYTSAAALERAARFPPLLARTEYWHARGLLERDRPGDRERATTLLDEVVEITDHLGMRLLHQQATDLSDQLRASPAS